MNMLTCDRCKNILEEPLSLPCGFNVCERHLDELSADSVCAYCNAKHQSPYFKNLKLLRILRQFNNAKNVCTELQEKAVAYNNLTDQPGNFIKNHFDRLEEQVLREKNQIIELVKAKIDSSTHACLQQIDVWRKQCLGSLDSIPVHQHLEYVTKKIKEFKMYFACGTTSDEIWDYISQTSDMLKEKASFILFSTKFSSKCYKINHFLFKVTSQIEQLKSQLLLNTRLSFQSEFDYDQPIRFGKIVSIGEDIEAEAELKSEPSESISMLVNDRSNLLKLSAPLENEIQSPSVTVLTDQSIVDLSPSTMNTSSIESTSVIEQNDEANQILCTSQLSPK